MLRVTNDEWMTLIEIFSARRSSFEADHAQYDVRESVMAVGIFSEMARSINFSGNVTDFLNELTEVVKNKQQYYPDVNLHPKGATHLRRNGAT
ncbi:hypothetical protein CW735_15595 [Alteromonas sp. MB-3u-76]|uniref:hypothetical protein n=1 Tax=Alteromonas sp. MB-3u-76 TaxID=2058133 RepID=UPI000C30A9C6|nr:hypothetical protein [Alteromonas sp. MB-3u-76]AUC89438.1 hypothetical protein CW735_15595 [Alteromonas sp. MB-3u-76]